MEVPKVDLIANSSLAKPSKINSFFSPKRFFAFLLIPCLIAALLVLQPQQALAASGGRIGGGRFSSPSIPRGGSGGYGGSYRGGYGGYRGGGMGFPFILPIFGFGGGGLFGFLILLSIAGVIANSIRGSNSPTIGSTSRSLNANNPAPVNMVQLQIGLLASAKNIQTDLRELASSANTSDSSGLQRVLQETTLSILRKPNLWVYANLETGQVPFNSAESTFNRLSLSERSKLTAEITTNISGKLSSDQSSEVKSGEAATINEYIAVTLLIASRKKLALKEVITSNELEASLQILGSISSTDLIALEVIWQPEGSGDVLSGEELVTKYPNLKHL